jgi:5,10-methylenetetrahydromethanopterin reductase
MRPIKYGIFLWNDQPVPRIAEQVQLAEELGYDTAWLLDSQLVGRELYTTMAVAADRTSRITLAPGVTHFATRHPTVMASGFASLAEVAPGRIQLAVGFGDSAIRGLGGKPTKLEEYRQNFELTRRLLQGESVPYNGQELKLAWADPELTRQIPLYTCPGQGPKSQGLAGELGCPVVVLCDAHELPRAIAQINAGAAKFGKTAKDLGISWWAHTSISDDWDAVKEHMQSPLSIRIRHHYYDYKRGSRPESDLLVDPETARQIAEGYNFLEHATSKAEHSQVLLSLPDEQWKHLLRGKMAGSPEEVAERIRQTVEQYEEIFEVVMYLHVDSPRLTSSQVIKTFAERVRPLLTA